MYIKLNKRSSISTIISLATGTTMEKKISKLVSIENLPGILSPTTLNKAPSSCMPHIPKVDYMYSTCNAHSTTSFCLYNYV